MRSPVCLAVVLAAPLLGGASPTPSPSQVVDAAAGTAWRTIASDNLLVIDLAGGPRVVIELAPAFAPVHIASIRSLARAGWWSGASIVRVQDNYVVQWGAADTGRPLPAGVDAHPPAEYDREVGSLAVHPLGYPDPYAATTGYADGWPVASDGRRVWLTHCYGMVGVGRDMPPDTGNGSELYAVIGQAPRHLDRNIALVGRVIEGMPVLAAMPRGTGNLGFYDNPAQRVPIRQASLAADLPASQRPRYEAMRSDAPAFAAYLAARADRRDAFFIRPAHGVDVCNAPVPIRPAP